MIVGGIGGARNPIRSQARLQISSRSSNFRSEVSCLVLKEITEMMPNVPLNKVGIPIPFGVIPADPEFEHPNRIDLLIGAGLFWRLLCVGQHRVGPGNLTWQKTLLGWVLGGSIYWPDREGGGLKTCHAVTNAQLHESISRFWEVEEISRREPSSVDAASNKCEEHFRTTTGRDDDGRYVVSIPFDEKIVELGESREQAERRLISLERRFRKNPELHQGYIDFMREYESLGHMSKVDENSLENQLGYYLPHHAVYKESSTTTKLRVVFDGSAKTSSGISLNDAQLVGMPVQSDLVTILLRFRKHRYVLSADIEKMYRQIRVREDHRRFQRILWRSNANEPISVYDLNTITYGTASASFLATRVLKKIGEDCMQSHPLASRAIIHDFYVDDLLTGCDSLEGAVKLKASLTEVLGNAGMPLRKWASNHIGALGSDRNGTPASFEIADTGRDPKTLGICWTAEPDELRYSLRDNRTNKITKRTILSEIAQIFDPLGLISPIVIRAKFIMKRLWRLDVGWDETLSQEMHTQWNDFRAELKEVPLVVIPRRVVPNNPREIELHGFSDASEQAFGATVYLRSKTVEGAWSTRLLCAKSRVAPLKSLSLPRLELSGALLLARLVSYVKEALQIEFAREYCWTDSTIVLAWLRAEPSRWKTFVANRVSETQSLTKIEAWHHVRSADNPADIVSRGIAVSALRDSDLWWHGPQWLSQNCDDWPASRPTTSVEIPEEKRAAATHAGPASAAALSDFNLASRYSSYEKLLRIPRARGINTTTQIQPTRSTYTEDRTILNRQLHGDRNYLEGDHQGIDHPGNILSTTQPTDKEYPKLLRGLKARRSTFKAQITRFRNALDAYTDTSSLEELKFKTERLVTSFDAYIEIQSELDAMDNVMDHLNERYDIEDNYSS
ncbi:PREDICTED: uncharacterized protein LOC108578252, partial [Habropoda laboriosa]|uniref:uncharacterized protein LOC108578252 n=1 Tax=Habropoda laboriosa TaxID=597456 RepID=UPI00083D4316